jgi:hypothetical protein
MQEYRPATRLGDVGAAVRVQPLESGDIRYVDLGRGRLTDDLKHLRLCVQDHDADQNRFAKVALTGHREYDGGESWYDVHPIIQGIRAFRDTLDHGSSAARKD